MKVQKLIAIVAILGLAATTAQAADGGLRRANATSTEVASVDSTPTQPQVIVIPNNGGAQTTTIQTQSGSQAVQQPTTVVEAAPASESKADAMRKARQNAEVNTEQKIVEKLEESRLKEEQQRAERLFGDKYDGQQPAPAAQQQPAPAPVVVAPSPVPAQPEQKPATNVTIEKVEIVQPEQKPAAVEPVAAPVAESKAKLDDQPAKPEAGKYYVGGTLGLPNYNASNVKTQYGLGVSAGMNIDANNAIEVSFLYSSYLIDTFWKYGLYNELTQYDLQVAYKYYFMTGPLKPYVGGSASYIARNYQDRIKSGTYWGNNQSTDSEQTNAVDVGLLAGVDYVISDRFTVGAGLDYNHNLTNSRNNFTSVYHLEPDDTKALEEIDYYTFKINAKLSF